MITVGIWGHGTVGTATAEIFRQLCPHKVQVIYFDKYKTGPFSQNDVANKAQIISINYW
ncbi:MAG: hypothetical protein NT072_11585 [Deltaproteobacteria bacterium]|nr:hypothetical protein [Deltaproteobacteria bacterium]